MAGSDRHNDAFRPAAKAPPISWTGYAVFVKLWELKPGAPVDFCCRLVDVLDEKLLELVNLDEQRHFPSPYGGAIVLDHVDEALKSSRELIQLLAKEGIKASIGITWGRFSRIFNVTGWNTAALAMNTAARMASDPANVGRVLVDPKVVRDAQTWSGDYHDIFGHLRKAKVKRSKFEYHRIEAEGYAQFPL